MIFNCYPRINNEIAVNFGLILLNWDLMVIKSKCERQKCSYKPKKKSEKRTFSHNPSARNLHSFQHFPKQPLTTRHQSCAGHQTSAESWELVSSSLIFHMSFTVIITCWPGHLWKHVSWWLHVRQLRFDVTGTIWLM